MEYACSWHTTLEDIPQAAWDRLAAPLDYPFLEWSWLYSLEKSGCVETQTGWQPLHLAIREDDKLVACAALYLKAHSRGEFVFDQEWAEVSEQIGVRYYPKMLGMSPFSAARGYRFLFDEDQDPVRMCKVMMKAIDSFCKEQGISSCHFLHCDPEWGKQMEEAGLSAWMHHSLIWENEGFTEFDDYLNSLKRKQRKNVKAERRSIDNEGLDFQVIRGEDATEELFSFMYDLYADTCRKFWGWSHYLNRDFFLEIHRTMRHAVTIIAGYENEDGGLPVAMSFLVHKGDWVFGRYWGCREQYNQLHFETCYYQSIDWAIQAGKRFFDAGSGSAHHKKRRGFPASETYSLHRHYHPLLKELWRQNIEGMNDFETRRIQAINGEDPNLCV